MVAWLVNVFRLTREMRKKAADALEFFQKKNPQAARKIQSYLEINQDELWKIWPKEVQSDTLSNLSRHISFGEAHDYRDMLNRDIPGIEDAAERYALSRTEKEQNKHGLESFLHPVIKRAAFKHFQNGHLRDAVLNAYIAVFDYIREITKIDADGARLVGQVFAPSRPRLVLSTLATEAGRNDQTGFMNLFQGAYIGIRNPKAHTIQHDLDGKKAAQYLVFASLLARRVEEAQLVDIHSRQVDSETASKEDNKIAITASKKNVSVPHKSTGTRKRGTDKAKTARTRGK